MILLTLLTCRVKVSSAYIFLQENKYCNIKVRYNNYFFINADVDSGYSKMNVTVINAYAKYYLVNKKIK